MWVKGLGVNLLSEGFNAFVGENQDGLRCLENQLPDCAPRMSAAQPPQRGV
jgi:hypothetical protein